MYVVLTGYILNLQGQLYANSCTCGEAERRIVKEMRRNMEPDYTGERLKSRRLSRSSKRLSRSQDYQGMLDSGETRNNIEFGYGFAAKSRSRRALELAERMK